MNLPPHFLQDNQRSPICNIAFNSDGSLFASAELEGWRIWESSTLGLVAQNDTPDGSLSIVLPLEQSNVVFLVGGPPSPLFSPNKVIAYNLITQSVLAALEFDSSVLGLAVRVDKLAVALKNKVVLFGLGKRIHEDGHYETAKNPRGLLTIACDPAATLMAIPGRQAGQVALVQLPNKRLENQQSSSAKTRSPPFPAKSIIMAHTAALSALATTNDGSVLATSSLKGTLIRIWDTTTATLIHELRRGTDPADIFSLALRPDCGAVACASDKGTVHLWGLAAPERQRQPSNVDPASVLKPYLPKYFSSAWSTGQFRLPPPEAQAARVVPFLGQLAEEKRAQPTLLEEDVVRCFWIKSDGNSAQDNKKVAITKAPTEILPEYVLVAVTRSGGYFKLSLSSETHSGKSSQKQRDVDASGFGPQGQCELLDHRRFDQRDGW